MNPENEYTGKLRSRGPNLRVLPPSTVRVAPHSLEAEAGLLSCCLLDGATTVGRCMAAGLTARGFYSASNALVYAKICELHQTGKPVDLVVLAEELRASGQLEGIGGYEYLTRITENQPTTAQAGYFLDRVIDLALLRAAIMEFTSAVEVCHGFNGDLEAFLGATSLKAHRLADHASRRKRDGLKERLARRHAAITQELAGQVDKSRWLYTGLPWLDACILPFDTKQEDWMVIIAGPPSGGKSSFMRQIAVHNVDMGKRGVVFLLETGLRWVDQAAASYSRCNLREKDQWLPERRKAFDQRYEQLMGHAEDRLWVFEDIYTVEDIERQVRAIDRQIRDREMAAGVPLAEVQGLHFAVVDYLQIVGTQQPMRNNREQEVAYVSKALKKLFKSMDITGFVGAQINRASRGEAAKVPTLTALRESGSIEQDADRVIFVHTPDENRAGQAQDGNTMIDEVDIVQRKSRNGPRDVSVGVLFHKTYTRYEEAVRKGDVRPGLPKPPGGYKREAQS